MFNILVPKGGATTGTVTTGGAASANQVAYFTSATVIAGDSDLIFDGTTLTGTRIAIGTGATTTNIILAARKDQNALTRQVLRNSDTGSSSRVQYTLNTDTGDVDFEATSVARGAVASINVGSSYTGGFSVDVNGTNPLVLKTNSTTRLSIAGAGTATFSTPVVFENGSIAYNSSGTLKITSELGGANDVIGLNSSSLNFYNGTGSVNCFPALHAQANLLVDGGYLGFSVDGDPGATSFVRMGSQTLSTASVSLHLRTQQAVAAAAALVSTHALIIKINNVEYKIMLVAV